MKFDPRIPVFVVVVISILALFGAILIAYGTHWGPWADDDSVEYFEAARNLAEGRGLILIRASGDISPLSSRPPFYPIILSVARFVDEDLLNFARWLDLSLFVILIVVIGFGTYILCRQPILSISISALILTSPTFLMIYSSALAEPVYFTLGTSSLILLNIYLQKGKRSILVTSALLAGLAFLSRYSGVAFVISGGVGLMLFSRRAVKQRLGESILFVAVSCIILLPWLYGVFRGGDTPGIYQFEAINLWRGLAPIRVAMVNFVWSWLPFQSSLPLLEYRAKFVILVVAFTMFILFLLAAIRSRRDEIEQNVLQNPFWQLAILFTLFTISHIMVLTFSYVYVQYPQPALIERIFSPIYLGGLFALFPAIYFLEDIYSSNKLLILLTIFVTGSILISNIQESKGILVELHTQGKGYTSVSWRSSKLIDKVFDIPEDITLISNESEAILFWTNRPAFRIPELYEKNSSLNNFLRFGEDEDDQVQRLFRDGEAALVLFNNAFWQFWPLYEEETPEKMEGFTEGLFKYFNSPEGAIYFYEPPEIR